MREESYFKIESANVKSEEPSTFTIRYSFYRGMRAVGVVDAIESDTGINLIERKNFKIYGESFVQRTAHILLHERESTLPTQVNGRHIGTLFEVANTESPKRSTTPLLTTIVANAQPEIRKTG